MRPKWSSGFHFADRIAVSHLLNAQQKSMKKGIAQPHHIFNLRSESAPWLNHSFNFSLLYHFYHLLRCEWRWSNRMSLRVTLCNWINIVFGYALVWRDAKSLNYYYHRLRAVPFISHQRTNECSRIVLLAIACPFHRWQGVDKLTQNSHWGDSM